MASLTLTDICKVYPNGFEAVKNFNLQIEDKEFDEWCDRVIEALEESKKKI